MAKISVSLPDQLKDQLDAYAQVHGHSVSQTVQLALETFLSQTPPPPPPPDGQLELLEKLVWKLRDELAANHHEVESLRSVLGQHRQCFVVLEPLAQLAGITLPMPPPLT